MTPVLTRVDRAIDLARQQLLTLQKPSGEWCGELEGDSILESECILLFHSIGRGCEPVVQKLAAHLERHQTRSGGWANYPGGPDDVSATVKAYFALKLAGRDPASPPMAAAREAAQKMGGISATNCFTQIYLALFGQCGWNEVPAIPPEIILLPRWFFLNIYAMSAWSRTILVPLSIIRASRPCFEVSHNIQELMTRGAASTRPTGLPLLSWRSLFSLLDRVLRPLELLPFKPWRKVALRRAERWTLEHLEKSDGLGAIFPPIVNTIWALLCRGYKVESAEVQSQVKELEKLILENGATARIQPCMSPAWDTALACIACIDSGGSPDPPELERAVQWLLSREVKTRGDWSVNRPHLAPGGWCFEYQNDFYPDVDDTAMVLLALSRAGYSDSPAAARGLNWVLGMQCRSGGWGSFDVDNDCRILCEFPFADHNAMIDPATSDITGRVLEMLGAFGCRTEHPAVQEAIRFLLAEQESDGSWFGRWGVNYLYGTWQVIKGLVAVGVDRNDRCLRMATRWLISRQNTDGGWGEGCETYENRHGEGSWPSAPSQTAWAAMGLIAAGEAESAAVRRAVEYLLRTQTEGGAWQEDCFTGTGFPRVFYLKYHLYPIYFPLWCLSMYRKAVSPSNGEARDSFRLPELEMPDSAIAGTERVGAGYAF